MSRRFLIVLLSIAILAVGAVAWQAGSAQAPAGIKVVPRAEVKVGEMPFLPSCAKVAPLRGDPPKEASVLWAEVSAGCVVPWHWHTPIEDVAMVGGSARIEMKDGAAKTANAGDFVSFPSKHVHQFTCVRSCTFYLVSSGPFDIHYVDAKGTEIPIEKALKSPGRPAAKK
jgi:quercetin dioxygenase-like cupin family protein